MATIIRVVSWRALVVLVLVSSCTSDTVADVDSTTRSVGSVDVDLVDDRGWTPLMRAAVRDDPAAIEDLLAAGADLDASGPEGLRAWHLAAIADAAHSIGVLRDAGADLEVRSDNGMDTLDHAAASGSVDVLRELIADGIDLDTRSDVVSQGHGYPADHGSTPLGLATRAGEFEAVEILLDAGADVNVESASGATPLLMAVFSDQPPSLVTMLLDHGADPSVVVACIERCSQPPGDALAWAERLHRDELVPILRAAPS